MSSLVGGGRSSRLPAAHLRSRILLLRNVSSGDQVQIEGRELVDLQGVRKSRQRREEVRSAAISLGY